jgi:hypothetical protein
MHVHIGCPGYKRSLLRYLHSGGMHLEWRYSPFNSYRPSGGRFLPTEFIEFTELFSTGLLPTEFTYGLGPRLVLLCVATIAMHAYCHKLIWMYSKRTTVADSLHRYCRACCTPAGALLWDGSSSFFTYPVPPVFRAPHDKFYYSCEPSHVEHQLKGFSEVNMFSVQASKHSLKALLDSGGPCGAAMPAYCSGVHLSRCSI